MHIVGPGGGRPAATQLADERKLIIDNLLVRLEMILVDQPCAMGSLNSLFQVALYLPS